MIKSSTSVGSNDPVSLLLSSRAFLLAQIEELQAATSGTGPRKSRFGTLGKQTFSTQLALALQGKLEQIEQQIIALGGAKYLEQQKSLIARKGRPPPAKKKPKDVLGTLKLQRQLNKPLPPPPTPKPSNVEKSIKGTAWQECYTDDGLLYYYNPQTGVTTWDNPMQGKEDVDPSEWEECQTDNGETFYYNHVTGQSQWQNPFFQIQFEQQEKGAIQKIDILPTKK